MYGISSEHSDAEDAHTTLTRQDSNMIVLGISDASQPKVADLEITIAVQQDVARLEIAVNHVGRVNVLQASKDLVRKVADVIIRDLLRFQELEEVRLHQLLHNVTGARKTNMG
jgi:hypothetical protein